MSRALGRPLLCVVTDGTGRANDLVKLAASAAAAGVDLLQIREPQLNDADLVALARRAVTAARGTRTAIVVNDRLDVAHAADADGVHLRADSAPAERVRAIAPEGFLIGRSVHSAGEAAASESTGGLDYLIFGTVFPSRRKRTTHVAAGLEELERACAAVRLPVLAIGGISVDRVPDVAAAGAAGIAAIGLFREAYKQGIMAAQVDRVRRAFEIQ